jgi:hypothetical protein
VYVLLGQLAGRYLEDSLHEVQNELAAIHAELATRLTSADPAAAFAREAPVALGEHASRFPRISARLLERNAEGAMKVISAWDPHRIEREAALHPANLWLDGKTSYQGFVRDGKIVLLVQAQPLAKSERLYLETSAPLEESLEERIQRDKSIYFTLLENEESEGEVRSGGIRIKIGDENTGQNESNTVAFRALNARRKDDARRMVTWGILLRGREFATGKEKYVGAAPLFVPVETVFGKSIGSGDAQGKLFLQIIYVLSGLFVFAELVSLMIGFTISRRITRSVHDMYQGAAEGRSAAQDSGAAQGPARPAGIFLQSDGFFHHPSAGGGQRKKEARAGTGNCARGPGYAFPEAAPPSARHGHFRRVRAGPGRERRLLRFYFGGRGPA